MAEQAAHFSITSQTKPTLFEVIAQDSLAATVRPALKRFFEFLASAKPELFNHVLFYYDELYLGISGLIEYYYIKNYDASFAEAFYGLRRIDTSLGLQNNLLKLSSKKQFISLACVVLLPYISTKIEQNKSKILALFYNENDKKDFMQLETLLYLFNLLKFIWKIFNIIQLLAYVSGSTIYYSPLLRLCGIAIDYGPSNYLPQSWSFSDIWSKKIKISTIFGSSLLRLFEISAFFIQFFQSWSSENYQYNFTALPTPPPPTNDSRSQKYVNKCPICLQNWKAATALQVSGYVFCYKCISTYLKNHSRCPVTQYPATTDDLIKLYYNITK